MTKIMTLHVITKVLQLVAKVLKLVDKGQNP